MVRLCPLHLATQGLGAALALIASIQKPRMGNYPILENEQVTCLPPTEHSALSSPLPPKQGLGLV